MTEDEREQTQRFLIDSGQVMHNAALLMLIAARQQGLSSYVAEAAISHAAMLISAQYFNGRRTLFVDIATKAYDCGEISHAPGSETRQ